MLFRSPRTLEAWRALPGVGPYTAGAVLSIAFGLSVPLVDGNVARVLARLFGIEPALGSRDFVRVAWELAGALVPAGRAPDELDPGQWNQALMELGACVCTSRAPRCELCPLSGGCAARRAGRTAELPRRAPRRKPIEVALEVFVVARGRRFLVLRRPAGARMAGLWELPTRELAPGSGARPVGLDRKSTRLNSSHIQKSRMPSSA